MIRNARTYVSGPGLGPLVARAVMGSAGLRLTGMFFLFLVGVQLARGLGAEGYGIFGLAMSLIALLTVPTEFGLPQLLTREAAAAQAASDWGRLRGILAWSSKVALVTSVCITLLVLISLIVVGLDFDSPLAKTLIAGLMMVPLVALGNLRSAALRGLQHIVKGQLPDTLIRPASFSLFLFIVPLLTVPLSPALAMWLGAASAAVAFSLAALMLRRNLPAEIHSASAELHTSSWWSSAIPMALTEGMRVLQGHLVILLMGVMAPLTLVGIFKVASSVALLIAVPVTLLNIVGSPILARLHAEGDRAKSQHLLNWLALGMTSGSLVLSIPFLLAGQPLLSAVFGQSFGAANAPLLILCASAVANGFFGANAVLLNMTGHHKRVTRASLVSLLLLAIISPPLIMIHGVIGAATANALSMLVWNFLMWRDARHLLSLDTSVLHNFKNPKGETL
jgi:O-antigen/teichoic acid export membrane protein